MYWQVRKVGRLVLADWKATSVMDGHSYNHSAKSKNYLHMQMGLPVQLTIV